jgi:hypothetical protein
MALLKAVVPWASDRNGTVDIICDLLWHFYTGGWIPLVPPALVLVLAATCVMWILRRENSCSQALRFLFPK